MADRSDKDLAGKTTEDTSHTRLAESSKEGPLKHEPEKVTKLFKRDDASRILMKAQSNLEEMLKNLGSDEEEERQIIQEEVDRIKQLIRFEMTHRQSVWLELNKDTEPKTESRALHLIEQLEMELEEKARQNFLRSRAIEEELAATKRRRCS